MKKIRALVINAYTPKGYFDRYSLSIICFLMQAELEIQLIYFFLFDVLWHNVTGCLIHVAFTALHWTSNNAENTVFTECVIAFCHSEFRLYRIRISQYVYNHVWVFHNDSSFKSNALNFHWCNIHLSLYSNNHILITILQLSLVGKQEYRNFCIFFTLVNEGGTEYVWFNLLFFLNICHIFDLHSVN